MGERTTDADAVWAAVLDLYQGFLSGDRVRVDSHIHDDATIWDSAEPGLAVGKAALDELRARRPADDTAPTVADLRVSDPVIDVWGDTALCRHLLTVTFVQDDVATQHVRNTGVWRRSGDRWLCVHNHEDVLAG